ncbi:unnamed protein product, partial [Prorocentrum cordatum]
MAAEGPAGAPRRPPRAARAARRLWLPLSGGAALVGAAAAGAGAACVPGGAPPPRLRTAPARGRGTAAAAAATAVFDGEEVAFGEGVVRLPGPERRASQVIGPAEVRAFDVPCQQPEPVGEEARARILQRYVVGSPQTVQLMGVVGSSKSAKTLRRQLIARRRDDVNVLVFGEPGLCKDRFAYLV